MHTTKETLPQSFYQDWPQIKVMQEIEIEKEGLEKGCLVSVTGAPYREVNTTVVTAPKLKVEDKNKVNNLQRIKTVKLNILRLKASLNRSSQGKFFIKVEGQTLKLK